jgi:hypothetical protein
MIQSQFSRAFSWWALVGCVMLLSGCSNEAKLYPVKGKVTVGGKDAIGATLTFHADPPSPNSFPSTGTIGEDGYYNLFTNGKQGIAAGNYIVTVVWPDPSKKPTTQEIMMGATAADGPDLLKDQYSDPKTSTIKVKIEPNMPELGTIEIN